MTLDVRSIGSSAPSAEPAGPRTRGAPFALEVSELAVRYANGVAAIRGVSLNVRPGECLAIVGESGSGKSTVALAALGLLPPGAQIEGRITVAGMDVVGATERQLRSIRGLSIGYVAQDPMRSFDPLRRVGSSVGEAWAVHGLRPPPHAVQDALGALGIDEPGERARLRPHQWSGGMLQRASIAAANAHTPQIVVADEPTSALDADRADAVLSALRSTQAAVLLISHDLELVGRHSDRVAVMYAGRIVEHGCASDMLKSPRHPYARALLAASPRPGHGLPIPLRGAPPRLDRALIGCAFAPRCDHRQDRCALEEPESVDQCACWSPRSAPE